MPLLLAPKRELPELQDRLSGLRRRWRRLIIFRGTCIALAVVVTAFLGLGILDRSLHLPAIVRATALVALLAWLPWFIWRRVIRPLREIADEVQLALKIEKQFPVLNDSLASTVELERHPIGSDHLRQATRQYAVREAKECNFDELLNYRPLRLGAIGLVLASTLAIVAAGIDPQVPRLAAVRLLDPFGDHPWPPQTMLSLEAPTWLPRGEPFVLRGRVAGAIPERIQFAFGPTAGSIAEQSIAVTNDGDSGAFVVRLEANRVSHDFRYRVRANDAETPWRVVPVRVPPQLAALDGRPSPQIHVEFPRYTELPPRDVADGGSVVDCVTGSTLRIRAATDRPVARASIRLAAEPPQPFAALAILSLASASNFQYLGFVAASQFAMDPIAATLSADGCRLQVTFRPIVAGAHVLRFEDEAGLPGHRALDVRLQSDPSPNVAGERPSAGRDLLHALPDARIPLVARIDDPMFGVRSVWLAYRCGQAEPSQRLVLFDAHESARQMPSQKPAVRRQLQHVDVDRQLDLSQVRHCDGRPLVAGDTLLLQFEADDFDDVTVPKQPGRSHEIALHIVSKSELLTELQKGEAEIEREVKELLQLQREALKLSLTVDANRRQSGAIEPSDRDRLLQAEQTTQHIRSRLGDEQEGLRSKSERLRSSTLPRGPERNRIESLHSGLKRLAESELPPIEPLLSESRRAGRTSAEDSPSQTPLGQAIARQREAERTLNELLERLQSQSEARNFRIEAGTLLRDQEKLSNARTALEQIDSVGRPANQLPDDQRQQLARLAERQSALADQSRELIEKLSRAIAEKQSALNQKSVDASSDSQMREIAALAAAREALRRDSNANSPAAGTLAELQNEASNRIARNELGQARDAQLSAERMLKEMQGALQESGQLTDDLLAKKRALDRNSSELEQLLRDQEQLQKQVQDAAKTPDSIQRQERLHQLAKEQRGIEERARDLAQRLSREQDDLAAQQLRRATRQMAEASERMDRGESATDKQDEILDQLDAAQDELAKSQNRLTEELQREQSERLRERLKGFKDRQESLVAESDRLFESVKRSGRWTRALQQSLDQLVTAEAALADELVQFAEKQLQEAKVLDFAARQAADQLKSLPEISEAVRNGPMDLESLPEDARAIQTPQRFASRRLAQLLDAQSQSEHSRQTGRAAPDSQPQESSSRPTDGISPLAQLTLLRTLQREVLDRTTAFAKSHPDVKQLTAEQRAELAAIQRAQTELSTLLNELPPADESKQPEAKEKP